VAGLQPYISARARKGQSHGTTGRLLAARARLQIDFSQNVDTKIADLR